MELSEFISKTIQNIDSALQDTEYVLGVSPERIQTNSEGGVIEFDILVNVTDTDTNQGGGKIQVLSIFTGGLDKEIIKEISHSSRIKFIIKRANSKPVVQTFHKVQPQTYR